MATSPVKDLMSTVANVLGGLHTADWLARMFKGEDLPEKAPLAAKMASGLFKSGDETVQHLVLEGLGKTTNGEAKRQRIIRFLTWMRTRGGTENTLTSLVAWYYFNGFRVKLAKMHEKGGENEPPKEPPKEGESDDLGVMFLQRIADIIGDNPDNEVNNYPEVEEFLKLSGVPVMPNLKFINELQAWILNFPNAMKAYDASFQEKYEAVEQENAKKGPVKRFLLKLIGQPVGEAPKKPKAEGGGLFGRGKSSNKADQSTTVNQTVNGGNIINYFSSGDK